MQAPGGNSFFSNAEALAFEILQQKLAKEAQRSAHQTLLELSALRALLGQGQLVYCIPLGTGPPVPPPFPHLPCLPFPEAAEVHHPPALPATSSPGPPPPAAPGPCPSAPPPAPPQSVVRVNLKGPQPKAAPHRPGSDECNLGKEGIEVSIDLREFLPAEISLDVEEKSVEIRAAHPEPHGCRTFARRYDLPACIVLDSVRCILTHDGFLLFSAAWCKMD